MKVGTKSILFGVHQFAIHPWFVALAWWKLYGFPFDPRLWMAFFVHDLGYFGRSDMDGAEGEMHVELGAWIMHAMFDWIPYRREILNWGIKGVYSRNMKWHDFTIYHSRFYAKRDRKPFSRLCVADKLSFCLMPRWLYLPLANASGEIHEYMSLSKARTAAGEPKYASMNLATRKQEVWWNDVAEYLRRWCDEHKDCKADTWTPDAKTAVTDSGVWK